MLSFMLVSTSSRRHFGIPSIPGVTQSTVTDRFLIL